MNLSPELSAAEVGAVSSAHFRAVLMDRKREITLTQQVIVECPRPGTGDIRRRSLGLRIAALWCSVVRQIVPRLRPHDRTAEAAMRCEAIDPTDGECCQHYSGKHAANFSH